MTDQDPNLVQDGLDDLELPVDGPVALEDGLSEKDEVEFIEALCLGRRTDTFDVLGHQVEMSTLTIDEELQLALVVKPWEQTQGGTRAYKTAVVAAAVQSIDGKPIYTAINPSDIST